MKKIFYILCTLALLVGCQKLSQVQEEDPTYYPYIFFDAEVASTKAELLNALPNTAGTSFGVFGYRENGAEVFHMYSTSLGNADFDYVAKMYRPNEGDAFIYDEFALWSSGKHSFYAFYPYDKAVVTAAGMDENSKQYIKYVQPTDPEAITDLMTASALEETYSSTTPVALTFNHRLFAFDIIVKNGENSGDLVVKEAEVKFTVPKEAKMYFDNTADEVSVETVTVNQELRTNDSGSESSDDLTATAEGSRLNPSSFLFVPCANIGVELKLTVSDSYSSQTSLSYVGNVTPAEGFKAGQKYALVINKVTAEWFEATVVDWETGADVDFKFE